MRVNFVLGNPPIRFTEMMPWYPSRGDKVRVDDREYVVHDAFLNNDEEAYATVILSEENS